MIGSDPAPAQRVNQVKAGGNNLCCAIVTRIEGGINVRVGVGCWCWWMDVGGWRCHSTGRMLKNVIRESVMSNLQQSHRQAGVEVDASTSTPCKLQFSPCGRKKKKCLQGTDRLVYFSRWILVVLIVRYVCICVPKFGSE